MSALCERSYRGGYDVRTAPCARPAGHPGFCEFVVLPAEGSREAVLLVGALLLVALGLLADGWFAWEWR